MIEVDEPGTLTTVQDAAGRIGWRHLGVPVCGALDPLAARLANHLVGNPDDAPLLEATWVAPRLVLRTPCVVAVAGADLGVTLDGRPLAPGTAVRARTGGVLAGGPRRSGVRAWIAFGGGLEVEPVLGSASTDLRSGFGGLGGRALRAGDRLEAPGGGRPHRMARPPRHGGDGPLRVLPGPQPAALEALVGGRWTVGREIDRGGIRLEGPAATAAGDPVRSFGLPLGAIQLPPDGRPIVMLADRPVTGGYPVAARVIAADLGRVAQLAPGDEVRLAVVDRAAADAARREAEGALGRLEPIGDEDAGPDWAGALG